MKLSSIFSAVAISTSILLVAGCSSPQKIETVNGETILTTDKPQEDEATGLITYKDSETGQIKQINRDQIRRMVELDD
ncbi:YgdI/YgdR family lipoprotein [Proteus sp. DFP240708]|uniref:YgdI/YgdR family lipoprotein n=2 Tax=Proteus TaxID=583 RepID=A0A6I7DAZ8_9GAMM|nr:MULTISPECIES: YgdI/YgdR family lipoprotein [Proteus]MBG2711465.1 YgdI/YgdR family lipoprotein [Proteus mirabilis]MBG2768641.1 YgdI/YgdR family lipoprotein [Proteus mirabilis]MBG2801047.1 YgdI/YgdR family lipoprotein [Proteus mirabilis]MBG3019646.1 YgdI/YgdR family lipoprotein [Proteus mirabilis]MBG3151294.1 YgdI/YgdR family lipoprotein [Proteus mirabilis]